MDALRTATNTLQRVDTAILGAGPGGVGTAMALRLAGMDKVLLIDKPLQTAFRVGESATPDIALHLARLGLDQGFAAQGHSPYYGTVSLWGSAMPIEKDFLRYGQGHGWHLQREVFNDSLCKTAQAVGISLWSPATLTKVMPVQGGGWLLNVRRGDTETQVFARVLVDASGRRAVLASRLGVARRRVDNLAALAVRVEASAHKPLAGRTLVEAIRHGWWYASPLPDGTAIVMLMSDHDVIRQEKLAKPEAFRRAWQDTQLLRESFAPPSANRLQPSVFPAMTGYLERAAGTGWLAVGDALLSMDPLTSSGIVGALSDAEAAAATLLDCLHGRRTWQTAGTAYAERAQQTLRRYLSERRRYYGTELRWADAPFWRVRQGAV